MQYTSPRTTKPKSGFTDSVSTKIPPKGQGAPPIQEASPVCLHLGNLISRCASGEPHPHDIGMFRATKARGASALFCTKKQRTRMCRWLSSFHQPCTPAGVHFQGGLQVMKMKNRREIRGLVIRNGNRNFPLCVAPLCANATISTVTTNSVPLPLGNTLDHLSP